MLIEKCKFSSQQVSTQLRSVALALPGHLSFPGFASPRFALLRCVCGGCIMLSLQNCMFDFLGNRPGQPKGRLQGKSKSRITPVHSRNPSLQGGSGEGARKESFSNKRKLFAKSFRFSERLSKRELWKIEVYIYVHIYI